MTEPRIVCVPDKSTPVIHLVPSNENEPGLFCAIFFEQNELTDSFPMLAECPSVYMIASNRAECFKTFGMSAHSAVILSIPTYLELLNFFKDYWKQIEVKINAQTEAMRQGKNPIPMEMGLHFMGHGSAQCTLIFSDGTHLHIRKDSRDPIVSRFFVHLQKDNQSIEICPAVMIKLANNVNALETLWNGNK